MLIALPQFNTSREALNVFWNKKIADMAADFGISKTSLHRYWLSKSVLEEAQRDRILGVLLRTGRVRFNVQVQINRVGYEAVPNTPPVPTPAISEITTGMGA